MADDSRKARFSWRLAAGIVCTGLVSTLIGGGVVVAIDQIPRVMTDRKPSSDALFTDAVSDRALAEQVSTQQRTLDGVEVSIVPWSGDDWPVDRDLIRAFKRPAKRHTGLPARHDARWYLLGELGPQSARIMEYWIEPGELPVRIGEIASSSNPSQTD